MIAGVLYSLSSVHSVIGIILQKTNLVFAGAKRILEKIMITIQDIQCTHCKMV